MEIKHTFTDSAEDFLATEVKRLNSELRDESINEAFRSRGKPVEVTTSDVRRAAEHFHKKRAETFRFATIGLALRAYIWMGIAMVAAGALLVISHPAMGSLNLPFRLTSEQILRVSANLFAVGASLITGALFMRSYFQRARSRWESRRSPDNE